MPKVTQLILAELGFVPRPLNTVASSSLLSYFHPGPFSLFAYRS